MVKGFAGLPVVSVRSIADLPRLLDDRYSPQATLDRILLKHGPLNTLPEMESFAREQVLEALDESDCQSFFRFLAGSSAGFIDREKSCHSRQLTVTIYESQHGRCETRAERVDYGAFARWTPQASLLIHP